MKAAIAAAAFALAALSAGAAGAADSGYHNNVAFDVAGANDIAVLGINGDVRLIASATNRVHIAAVLHAESQQNLERMSVKTSVNGQKLLIQSQCPKSGYWIFHITRCSIDYTITYPRSSRVEIRNDNGDVRVEGAATDLTIENSHGDVRATLARDWHGVAVAAKTSMGDITLNVPAAFAGHLKAKTWVGDVNDRANLGDAASGAAVTLQTRFGDITVTRG